MAEVRSDLSSKAEQRGRVGSSASNLPKALQPSSSIGSQKRPDRNRLDHSLSGESPDGSRQAARSHLSMYVAGPRRSRGPFLRESGAEISQILRGPGLPFSGHTEISTAQGYTDSLSLARWVSNLVVRYSAGFSPSSGNKNGEKFFPYGKIMLLSECDPWAAQVRLDRWATVLCLSRTRLSVDSSR